MSVSEQITAMYRGHPISAAHILQKIGSGSHPPEALWPHDQDHYGGLDANTQIADHAGMKPGMMIADFCAGLGGPARWYAHVRGVKVIGIDLTPDRVKGAAALNAICGLAGRVTVLEGSVTDAPISDAFVDAVVSQEAFLHIPDYPKAVEEAFRILKPGGRSVISTLTSHDGLKEDDAELLRRGLGFQALPPPAKWKSTFEAAGFSRVETVDLTTSWAEILKGRLAMYTKLRQETQASGHASGDDWFHRAYPAFVKLISRRILGGILITGHKA